MQSQVETDLDLSRHQANIEKYLRQMNLNNDLRESEKKVSDSGSVLRSREDYSEVKSIGKFKEKLRQISEDHLLQTHSEMNSNSEGNYLLVCDHSD